MPQDLWKEFSSADSARQVTFLSLMCNLLLLFFFFGGELFLCGMMLELQWEYIESCFFPPRAFFLLLWDYY